MTDNDIMKLAEDLYYNDEEDFCPICTNEGSCNWCCFGLDFHKEFVDLEKARKLFDKGE